VPSDADVEEAVERVKSYDHIDPEKHRKFIKYDPPTIRGVFARGLLVEIDEDFAKLDLLVALEEFAEAKTEERGGKDDEGEGRIDTRVTLSRERNDPLVVAACITVLANLRSLPAIGTLEKAAVAHVVAVAFLPEGLA
jgi:hypothetical protein